MTASFLNLKWRSAWKQHVKKVLGVRRVTDLPSTIVLWAGKSLLTGDPIMVVAQCNNASSKNVKTGDMIQVAVMRQDIAPGPAYDAGLDDAVCPEDCVHRSKPRGGIGTCYVDKHRLGFAWQAAVDLLHRGIVGVPDGFYAGAEIRLTNDGDGAAVPLYVWKSILCGAKGHSGYTAHWRNLDAATWGRYFMASVSSPADAMRARAAGWRWFASSGSAEDDAAFAALGRECNADAHGLTCVQCHGCNGNERGARRPSFWLAFHGAIASKVRRINNETAAAAAK
jgi:cytochrome c553